MYYHLKVELEAVEYESAKGMSMQHSLPLDVLTEVMKECTLITPTGETFELYPNENITDPTIQFDEGALWPKCGIKIGPLTTNHIGKWILQGLYDVNDDINNEETEKTVIQEIQLKVIGQYFKYILQKKSIILI